MSSAEFLTQQAKSYNQGFVSPKVKGYLNNPYHSQGKFSRRQIDDIFLVLPRQFMQNAFIGDSQFLISGKNKKYISLCCILRG